MLDSLFCEVRTCTASARDLGVQRIRASPPQRKHSARRATVLAGGLRHGGSATGADVPEQPPVRVGASASPAGNWVHAQDYEKRLWAVQLCLCTRPGAVAWAGAEAPHPARRVASRHWLVMAPGRVSGWSVSPTDRTCGRSSATGGTHGRDPSDEFVDPRRVVGLPTVSAHSPHVRRCRDT
jgi:hypothetical protein